MEYPTRDVSLRFQRDQENRPGWFCYWALHKFFLLVRTSAGEVDIFREQSRSRVPGTEVGSWKGCAGESLVKGREQSRVGT